MSERKEMVVPALGESISEVVVGFILKKEGEMVRVDEEIAELQTDKVNQMLYALAGGTIHWTVKEGDTVAVGGKLGYIEVGAEALQKIQPTAEFPQERVKNEKKIAKVSEEESKQESKQEMPKEGLREVVEKPIAAVQTAVSGEKSRKKITPIRKKIAERLLFSVKNTASLTTFNEIDMSEVMAIREKNKEAFQKAHRVKLGFLSFFVTAVVHAMKNFPLFNQYIEGEDIVERSEIDISIAVSTDRGLVVPVLRQADALSFADIERGVEDFAQRARQGKLTLQDLTGGSFTITNGGVFGSLLSTPILNPPQVGILGLHKIEKRAVVVNDQIVIRPMMYVALTYDHRLIDGKEAVQFLMDVKNFLEDPTKWFLNIP